ncbi:MAG: hypothetical protein QW578_07390, partial [Thermoplasmatales archaeon]
MSATYGQYDNGQYVFNNYWNFAGTTLPSTWAIYSNSGSYSVNNGLVVSGYTDPSTGYNYYEEIYTTIPINPQTNTTDIYGYLMGANSIPISEFYLNNSNNPSYGIAANATNTYILLNYNGNSASVTITSNGSQTSNSIWSIWITNSKSYASLNYSNTVSNTQDFTPVTSANISIYTLTSNGKAYATWIRTRTTPPNGIMPTISNIQLTTSANSYAVIPIGSTVNITNPNNANATWYVNGAIVSTNTTYYTTTFSQPGIYSIYYVINGVLYSNYLNITVYDPNNIVTLAYSTIDLSQATLLNNMYSYSLLFMLSSGTWVTAINVSLASTLSNGNAIQPITVGWEFQVMNGYGAVVSNLTGSTITVQQNTVYTFPINMMLPANTSGEYALTFYPLSNSSSDIQNITNLGIAISTSYISVYHYVGILYTNSAGSSTQNNSLYTNTNVFQSPTQFGNLTVMESGLLSGTSWSVTLTNNGNVFSSTTNSILIQLPYNATFTFTVSSSNSLYTPSPSSFTVNTSLFNLSPSITKSITFNYAIPSPYVQITEYPDDAGNLDPY